jgi:succinate dehydrogenase/fumarate reductase iron-sulfur protein
MAVIDRTRTVRLRIARDDHFEEFEVPVHDGMTVFDALRWVQLHRDPTLSMRHSCLHASCGTCGMRVNGREELACVCMVADLGEEVTVEPLANLPLKTDLVVDMDPFYDHFPDPHPIIRASEEPSYVRLEDCLECALCVSACPVAATCREFVGPAALGAAGRLLDEPRGSKREAVLEWLARPEAVWLCSTCMACVEACPAGIGHMTLITEERRALVEQGELDPLLARALQNVAAHGNSFGKSARLRARWAKPLDFRIPDARREPVEYLWFVGDFASFDARAAETSRRLATILHAAGVSFGLLYEGERSTGNDVRRAGEEGLFELLAEQNMEALRDAQFDAVFTTDPHSLHALRNEYPELGQPVYHYTELLVELANRGVLELEPALRGTRVTYHDPCYLARYNGITAAPRQLIAATGAELVEMPRHGAQTFCCGAGGGRIWMPEPDGERPAEQRIREAQALEGIEYFVVSCPKDLAMYSAAADTVGGVQFEVVELTALVKRALDKAGDRPSVASGTGAPAG